MSAWTRALKFLATGTISLLLTSCYGTIQAMYGVPFRFREATVRTRTVGNQPIPGLKVVLRSGDIVHDDEFTDAAGQAILSGDADLDFEILVTDQDGEANLGDFADSIESLPKTGGSLSIDLTMYQK